MTEQEFWKILHDVPEPKPIFYRLYYDDSGNVLFYSMEDLPGNYLEIDQKTFSLSPTNVKVRDGKLVEVRRITTAKLVPTDVGTPCHPDDVCIVVPEAEPHQRWSKITYESD